MPYIFIVGGSLSWNWNWICENWAFLFWCPTRSSRQIITLCGDPGETSIASVTSSWTQALHCPCDFKSFSSEAPLANMGVLWINVRGLKHLEKPSAIHTLLDHTCHFSISVPLFVPRVVFADHRRGGGVQSATSARSAGTRRLPRDATNRWPRASRAARSPHRCRVPHSETQHSQPHRWIHRRGRRRWYRQTEWNPCCARREQHHANNCPCHLFGCGPKQESRQQ